MNDIFSNIGERERQTDTKMRTHTIVLFTSSMFLLEEREVMRSQEGNGLCALHV